MLIVSYIPPGKTEILKKQIDLIKKANAKYKNVVWTGGFNAKSQFWYNMENNTAGNILEEFILDSDFVCINDGAATRRNVSSVIDLVLVKPQLIKSIKSCTTLTHEHVRSDHIPVLLDIDDGIEQITEEEEKFILKKNRLGEMERIHTQ